MRNFITCTLHNILLRMRLVGHVAHVGELRNEYNIFVGEPEGNRPIERPRRRWVDNIRMYFKEVG
jgi:hypothetical protein